MQNLFRLILKHNFFLLFLFFEIISFILLIQNNYYQQSQYLTFTNEISGTILNTSNNIKQYFFLKQVNKFLAEENSKLSNQKLLGYIKIDTSTYIKSDSVYKLQYYYINAKVVNNSFNKRNNYLTLNKGYNQGISKDMAVVSSHGIVGIIKDVSPNFSTVISLLHSKTKISAKIKQNNYAGTVIWDGKNSSIGLLLDIPTHIKINQSDTIITSGYSYIFPEGMEIGRIIYFEKGENFYTIYFRFSTEFQSLSYVHVIKNIMKNEQILLENKTENE